LNFTPFFAHESILWTDFSKINTKWRDALFFYKYTKRIQLKDNGEKWLKIGQNGERRGPHTCICPHNFGFSRAFFALFVFMWCSNTMRGQIPGKMTIYHHIIMNI
jgi:hypothetical protein